MQRPGTSSVSPGLRSLRYFATASCHILSRERILEFAREDHNTVCEDRRIETLLAIRLAGKLAHNGEEIGPVEAGGFLIKTTRRREVRQVEFDPMVLDAAAEDINSAPTPELLSKAVEKAFPEVGTPEPLQLFLALGLAGNMVGLGVGLELSTARVGMHG